jgi:hypothetical protein
MKKLLVLILVCGAFVGGYELGRQPDAPDIIGQARDAAGQAQHHGEQLSAHASGAREQAEQAGVFLVEVAGKLYRVGETDPPAKR